MRTRSFFAAILFLATGVAFAAPVTTASPPDYGRFIVYRPKMDYPFEARKRGLEGTGVFVVRIHIPSGRVTQVIVGKSTGARILDDVASATFMRFRFKPGAIPYTRVTSLHVGRAQTKDETFVKLPVTFTLDAR